MCGRLYGLKSNDTNYICNGGGVSICYKLVEIHYDLFVVSFALSWNHSSIVSFEMMEHSVPTMIVIV